MEKLFVRAKAKQLYFEKCINKQLERKYKKGSNTLEILVISACVVIVAALILKLLQVAMPDLWQSLINKVKSIFSL